MKLIVITSPHFIEGEASLITSILNKGIDTVHLRKPDSTIQECAQLLDIIPHYLHKHIVTHYHHELCRDYDLAGIHISPCHMSKKIERYNGTTSRSCHSFKEINDMKQSYDYLFLSPIFNSISKEGYKQAFTLEQLQEASLQGIIDNKVVALGGVTAERIPLLKSIGFGGVALLGDVWKHVHTANFEKHIDNIISQCGSIISR